MNLFTNKNIIVDVGIPYSEADIAVIGVDADGNTANLINYGFPDYAYKSGKFPGRDELQYGFFFLEGKDNRKPIVFFLEEKEGRPIPEFKNNLYNALQQSTQELSGKRVWIPVTYADEQGITLRRSYEITIDIISYVYTRMGADTTFLVSLPYNEEGNRILKDLIPERISATDVSNGLTNLNIKCFLADSDWNGVEQDERFYKDSIWEKKYEDGSYAGIINTARKNDLIILKSNVGKNDEENHFRIKAVGMVTRPSKDGAGLSVGWRIKNLKIDMPGMAGSQSSFATIDYKDVLTIFSYLDWRQLKLITSPSGEAAIQPVTIAGLISDSDNGEDLLRITNDVAAFARVISAKSFGPPLAIALFGKWGSGKSFFMRKLKEQVVSLSGSKANDTYCNGIAHIQFNAWSYMDANLWASMVSKIFEGLYEYISENSKSGEAKKEIEQQLNNQLAITKEEKNILENKQTALIHEINLLQQKRKFANEQLEIKINSIKTKTLSDALKTMDQQFKVKEKIKQALEQNPSFIITEAELKGIVPETYWDNPKEALHQIQSKYTFLKEFFKRGNMIKNLLWITCILIIIIIAPFIITAINNRIRIADFIIPQAGMSLLILVSATWQRAETVYKKLQPIIGSFWSVKEEYEQSIQATKTAFDQEQKALTIKIEKDKSQILQIEKQIQEAEVTKKDIEFKLTHALGTEALYSFIDKRSKSDDYKKHLGIISIIRHDFETLNDLFTDHNKEFSKLIDKKNFLLQFDKPLERIILYIDDLDRCPEENVVQVLEAVNLLMAFPLFIVIVGVDSRWVKNALLKKHASQFGTTGQMPAADGSGIAAIEVSNYLEKIFQIPFHLKDADPANVKEMIKTLATHQSVTMTGRTVQNESQSVEAGKEKETAPPGNQTVIDEKANTLPDTTLPLLSKPEMLVLTETEIGLMQDMSAIIGNNPRAIKRFVNIFKIIKAHEEYAANIETELDNYLPIILFLLAVPLGIFKQLLPALEIFIGQEEGNSAIRFSSFLQQSTVPDDLISLKRQMDVTLSERESFHMIQNAPAAAFYKHNHFIRRFTFKNI